MKKFKCAVFAVLMILLLVTGVNAGHRAGSFTLSPMVGGYLFDSDLNIDDTTALGGFAGYNLTDRIGMEAAYFDADTELDGTSEDVDTSLFMMNGLYHFMPEERLVPYISLGVGMVGLDPDNATNHDEVSASLGAGLKYFLTDDVALRADVRDIATFPENNLLYSVGVVFYLGGKTAVASLPEAQTTSQSMVETTGPAETMSPPVVQAAVQPKIVDSDNDGVPDAQDKCPKTPKGADVDARGCWVIKNLNFDTSKDEIKPVYYNALKNVIKVLKQNPDLRVEVQGHTDSMGDRAFNEDLSQRRAQAVVDYLVGQGIDAQRLIANGYGPAKPIANNDTPQGRAQNRRVEINPLD